MLHALILMVVSTATVLKALKEMEHTAEVLHFPLSALHNNLLLIVLDVNECDYPVCDINANCSNTYGSYLCTCRNGYTGDGSQCTGRLSVVELNSQFV